MADKLTAVTFEAHIGQRDREFDHHDVGYVDTVRFRGPDGRDFSLPISVYFGLELSASGDGWVVPPPGSPPERVRITVELLDA